MDQIFGEIGKALGGFFGSPPSSSPSRRSRSTSIILWLAAAYWAFRDMQQRTENPILPYLAASFVIIFTPIFFPLAIFVYKIVRPHEKIGEVYERNLAEEALLAEVEAIKSCPTCARRVNDEWIICPTCRTRLNRVCPNCSRLVGLDWSLCAWCGKDFERRDVPAAAIAGRVRPRSRRCRARIDDTGRIARRRPDVARQVHPDRASGRPPPHVAGRPARGLSARHRLRRRRSRPIDGDAAATPTPAPAATPPPPPRPGRRPSRSRAAPRPALFVVGWLASLSGSRSSLVGALAPSTRARRTSSGLGCCRVGLIAAAGNQAIERRAAARPTPGRRRSSSSRRRSPSRTSSGRSSVCVLDAVLDVDRVDGLAARRPAHRRGVTALVYIGLVRLLVVGTGALSWPEMGLRPVRRTGDPATSRSARPSPCPSSASRSSSAAVLVTIFQVTSPTARCRRPATTVGLLLQLVAGAIIAPIAEEIFFRGFATTAWRPLDRSEPGDRPGVAALRARPCPRVAATDDFGQARSG